MTPVLNRISGRVVVYTGLLLLGALLCVRINLTDPEFSKSSAGLVRVAFSPDIWWQIVTGDQILATGQVPAKDTYSFTASGSQWIAYQWLPDVLMAAAARVGGISALLVLLVLLSWAMLLLLFNYAHLRSQDPNAAFLACLLALPALSVSISLRPQLMGYYFFLLTVILLERCRRGQPRALWALPPLFLLWVNTHGTFPLGFLAIGLYWVSGLKGFERGSLVGEPWTPEQRRQLAVIFLLCLLAVMVTPYGTQLAAYPLQLAFLQPVNVHVVEEWHPVPLETSWGKWVLGLVLLFLILQIFFPLRWRVEEMLLLGVAAYSGFSHRRMVFLLAIVLTPLLAVRLRHWVPRLPPARNPLAVTSLLLILTGTAVVGLYPSPTEVGEAVAQHYPTKAVDYLRSHPIPRPLFSPSHWGGYLRWALGPEEKVFMDTRLDMFEYAGVLSDYLEISNLGSRSLYLLRDKYEIKACLLQRDAPLATVLEALPNWKRVYADELSAIYVYD